MSFRKPVLILFLFAAFAFGMIPAAWNEAFKYDPHGKRDPFVPLIGQERAMAARFTSIVSIEDVKLEGIATGAKGKKSAIINGELVYEGYKAGDVEIKKITDKSVTLLISGKEYTVELPEEGGSKGE